MQTQQLPTVADEFQLVRPTAGTLRLPPTLSFQVVGCAALLGAAAIHASVIAGHYAEWPLAGWFFVAIQVTQTVAAVALALAPVPRVQLLALLATAGPLMLWVATRTVGLPLGPVDHQGREAVGVPDLACAALEVAAITAIAALHLRGRDGDSQRRPGRAARASTSTVGAVALVIAVTAAGVLGADSHSGPDVPRHGHPTGSTGPHTHP